ncbi:hypothetical protein [Rhizobium phaseoli]|uniref:hypothetical protein n=1 Tax=Rhizobium phaseoli TaxID=396 RepID=UPI0011AE71F2|nr:hypothetical protein [Rhizobium phaseoli]
MSQNLVPNRSTYHTNDLKNRCILFGSISFLNQELSQTRQGRSLPTGVSTWKVAKAGGVTTLGHLEDTVFPVPDDPLCDLLRPQRERHSNKQGTRKRTF